MSDLILSILNAPDLIYWAYGIVGGLILSAVVYEVFIKSAFRHIENKKFKELHSENPFKAFRDKQDIPISKDVKKFGYGVDNVSIFAAGVASSNIFIPTKRGGCGGGVGCSSGCSGGGCGGCGGG